MSVQDKRMEKPNLSLHGWERKPMAQTQFVTVEVNDADGSFSVDLTGFEGKGCDAVIKAFAEIAEPTKVVEKPEYKFTASQQKQLRK